MIKVTGWYPDPNSKKHLRFWDGYRWTRTRKLTRTAFWKRAAVITGTCIGGLFILVIVIALVSPPVQSRSTATSPASASSTPTSAMTTSAPPKSGAPKTPAKRSPSGASTSEHSRTVTSLPQHTSTTTPSAAPSATRGSVLAAALALKTKGRAPKTGYDRDKFGTAWTDTDGNGCDQRNDVLNRDLKHKKFDGCLVLAGVLHDPYTGRTIHFHRGEATSADVQIDHVVPLSDAWQKGAQTWSTQKRLRFATDTLNLYAVDGPTNASKGDGDTATWLPPNKSFRCSYVAHQVAVKKRYRLWATPAERAAMVRILSACPTAGVPKRAAIPDHPAPKPEKNPTHSPQPKQPPTQDSGSNDCAPGYSPCIPPYPPDLDCSDVNGPITVTGPDPHGLDGDGDGIACEDG